MSSSNSRHGFAVAPLAVAVEAEAVPERARLQPLVDDLQRVQDRGVVEALDAEPDQLEEADVDDPALVELRRPGVADAVRRAAVRACGPWSGAGSTASASTGRSTSPSSARRCAPTSRPCARSAPRARPSRSCARCPPRRSAPRSRPRSSPASSPPGSPSAPARSGPVDDQIRGARARGPSPRGSCGRAARRARSAARPGPSAPRPLRPPVDLGVLRERAVVALLLLEQEVERAVGRRRVAGREQRGGDLVEVARPTR